jgi:threonine efflux protein
MGVLLNLFVVHFLALLTPGPDALLVVRTSSSSPRKVALVTVVGVVIGLAVWAGLALAGMQLVFERAAWLQAGLKVLGGLYLIYLGAKMWRAAFAKEDTKINGMPRLTDTKEAFRTGLFTSLSNANAMIYFGSIFVTFLPAQITMSMKLAIVFMVILESLAIFGSLAVLLSLPAPQKLYQRAIAWIDPAAGTVFGIFGLKLLLGN